ncbi:MAG TPA: nucleotide exchange factor GrpE [Gemmatimonadaceae bacterium]|nr:nucleotide exchange factor GrpE [Gemmatimonadaceae bacterium]
MSDQAERDARDAGEMNGSADQARDTTESETAPASEGATSAASAGDDLRRQLDEQRDKYLRLAAEYDNFRKRALRERTEATGRGQAELARQLLDALDDLARFAHLDPAVTDATTVVEGAAMVERKLLKTLGSAGLAVVDPVDQTFDPNVHEAIATEPAAAAEDDHVVSKVYQVGYLFNGQLLRPARVVVKQFNG